MNNIVNNIFGALSGRFRGELEQASGMSLEQVQKAIQNGDEKSLCWLKKKVEDIRRTNPQMYEQYARMSGGRNPFSGSR